MSKNSKKNHTAKDDAEAALAESPGIDADLGAVLDILRTKVGHDFRCYKPSTLIRRIRRRMDLAKISSVADYIRFLQENPDEVALLQKDMQIGVTEFFRQPPAWKNLEEKAIAPLVEKAQPGSEIRIWVPGCSTGMEAYSLAILLAEQVESSGRKVAVQIFATDSDAASLATARGGTYSEEEIGNVSPERLKRFFTRKDGRYQVVKDIREQIVFAPQNITADPPFSRLDLISCRNLLIYLDQQVQRKIIALFHFSLREGGFLFLGAAETVGDREELFAPVSKKWRIYRRIGVGRRVGVEIPVRLAGEPGRTAAKQPLEPPSRMSLASGVQHLLLDRFVPACVMIDRKLQVLYVHGDVEDYLTFPPGELTTRVTDMAREGLRARLRGAIGKCLEANKSVTVNARVRRGEKSVPVKTVVSPLRYPREIDGLLLITFEDYRVSAAKPHREAERSNDIQQLEDELRIMREELQSTIEQLENSNDELKASNEEVTAANEELQSANEELETSKEELQSLNEELNTINIRLQEKVDELESVNNDVINLLSSTNIATVFLDKELKIKSFTPAGTHLMSLIPSDTGRSIADILCRFSDEALLNDARRVLADLTPLAKEVQADDGRWYIRRITPYRTQDDRIEGIVITFVDVADLKKAEEALRKAHDELEMRVRERTRELTKTNDRLQAAIAECKRAEESVANERQRFFDVLETLPVYVVLLTPDYHVPFANRFFRERFGESRDRCCYDYLFKRTEPCETCETFMVLKTGKPHRWEWLGPDGRNYDIHDFPFTDSDGSPLIMEVGIDITDAKRAEAALKEANETLEQRVVERTAELREARDRAEWLGRFPDENPNPVMRVLADGNVLYCNAASAEIPGWACEVGKQLSDPFVPLLGQAMAAGKEIQQDVELGGQFYSVAVVPIPGKGYVNVYGRDVTERKQAEEAMLRAKQEWERTFDAVPDLIALLDDRHRILRVNKAMAERLRITPKQCVGKTCYEVVHGLLFPPDFCPHTLTLADGREHTSEVFEANLGGDFLVSVTPLTDEQGRLIGTVHVARDITTRKKAEDGLKERTAQLEAANKELDSFSYSVSHDLRAPLRAIDGYSRMILKKEGDKFDEETTRKFNAIRSNTQMMGQLIDDLLTLSRVGKKLMSLSNLDMDAIVRDVWKELEIINPEKDLKLTIRSIPPGYGDATLIKQVYFNLLANAVKFTKCRDQALIEAGGYSEGNENVYYVKDNGTGFDMAYYDKLFGIFQRLHSVDDYEGTGVGLATVQRIIHRHGGRVWAEGKVDEGATFYFTLPEEK